MNIVRKPIRYDILDLERRELGTIRRALENYRTEIYKDEDEPPEPTISGELLKAIKAVMLDQ